MGGRIGRRRSRRQKQHQTDVTPGTPPRGITSDDLAEITGGVLDLRADTDAKDAKTNTRIDTVTASYDAQLADVVGRLDRVESVVDDLHSLSLAMAQACKRIRD